MDTTDAYTLLQTFHHSVHTAIMQIYSNLLRICSPGYNKTRTDKGSRTGNMENS